MDVMYFNGIEKKSERLVVRALHYITLHYITLHYITYLRLAWKILTSSLTERFKMRCILNRCFFIKG